MLQVCFCNVDAPADSPLAGDMMARDEGSMRDLEGLVKTGGDRTGAWSGEDECDVTPHASGQHWDYSWGHHQNLKHRVKNTILRDLFTNTHIVKALKEYVGWLSEKNVFNYVPLFSLK